MCEFCENIYPDNDVSDIIFGRGKYSRFSIHWFISVDDEGNFYLNVDPGDPYEIGIIDNVKYCPICGNKLVKRKDN